MTEVVDPTPDLPLLRKAVAWAEVEALKSEADPDREWLQQDWVTPADERAKELLLPVADCKTAYCIAGYVCQLHDQTVFSETAQELLGLTPDESYALFRESNTIEGVRAVAEQIAARGGETL